MSKHKPKWRKVPDVHIRQRWVLNCQCKTEPKSIYAPPVFCEESGIPICQDCGKDRKYAGTEMDMNVKQESK